MHIFSNFNRIHGRGLQCPAQLYQSFSPSLRPWSTNFGECPVGEHADVLCTIKNESNVLPAAFQFRKIAHFSAHPPNGKIPAGQTQDVIFSFSPSQIGIVTYIFYHIILLINNNFIIASKQLQFLPWLPSKFIHTGTLIMIRDSLLKQGHSVPHQSQIRLTLQIGHVPHFAEPLYAFLWSILTEVIFCNKSKSKLRRIDSGFFKTPNLV